jgi:hypothetical protein
MILNEKLQFVNKQHKKQMEDAIVGKKHGMISSRVYMDTPVNAYYYQP